MTNVNERNIALLTDLYQLRMLQAYRREEMFDQAVFTLFVRRLPPNRNFLLACGLEDALSFSKTTLLLPFRALVRAPGKHFYAERVSRRSPP